MKEFKKNDFNIQDEELEIVIEGADFQSVQETALISTEELSVLINKTLSQLFKDYNGCYIYFNKIGKLKVKLQFIPGSDNRKGLINATKLTEEEKQETVKKATSGDGNVFSNLLEKYAIKESDNKKNNESGMFMFTKQGEKILSDMYNIDEMDLIEQDVLRKFNFGGFVDTTSEITSNYHTPTKCVNVDAISLNRLLTIVYGNNPEKYGYEASATGRRMGNNIVLEIKRRDIALTRAIDSKYGVRVSNNPFIITSGV